MKGFFTGLAGCSTLVLLAAAAPAHAQETSAVPDYFSLRSRAPLAERYSLAEIQDHPDRFSGQLLEMRGVLTGVFVVNRRTSLVLKPASNNSWTVALPQRQLPPEWLFLTPGEDVRLLCRVKPGATERDFGYLELVAPIRSEDFEQAEEARARELLERVQRAEAARRQVEERKRQAELKRQRQARQAQQARAANERARLEKAWRARSWVTPSEALRGTWEMEGFLAVLNARESGVFGARGEHVGRWYQSDRYLEFRIPGATPFRFRWSLSDDRKALTLSRIGPTGAVIQRVTLLRR